MKRSAGQVTIRIDGKRRAAAAGEPLLAAARRHGADIPTLCSVEGLEPYGACRLCLVKVTRRGRSRVVTSCNYPAEEGLEVSTRDPRVARLRRGVAALLLARAPAAERVVETARRLGVRAPAFPVVEKGGRCILCGLCVNVCAEVVGAHAITFEGRGKRRAVDVPYGEEDLAACTACGACGFVCPTGCIDMEERTLALLRGRWTAGPRPCRWGLARLLPGAACDNDYDCGACSLDRRLREAAGGRNPAFLLRRAGGKERDGVV